jgi:hypothetical protein
MAMDVIVILLGWLLMAAVLVGAVVLGIVALIFLRAITSPNTAAPQKSAAADYLDEGDFHSGPEGYSPTTAYPDSFYGSRGFSGEDEFDGHDEGDFNR